MNRILIIQNIPKLAHNINKVPSKNLKFYPIIQKSILKTKQCNANNIDFFTLHQIGILTCGITGCVKFMYDDIDYYNNKYKDIKDRIFFISYSGLSGFVLGSVFGIMLPIILPINFFVAIFNKSKKV